MSVFIIDLRPRFSPQEQSHLPCTLMAKSSLRVAKELGYDWIRVEKTGHACEFMVAALVEQVKANWQAEPMCLVTMGRAEQAQLGTTFEVWRRMWPGAQLRAV